MTEDERKELLKTASAWKANAGLFRELGEECPDHLKFGYQSIAITFGQNAKIVEAIALSEVPKKDKYYDLFPEGQE